MNLDRVSKALAGALSAAGTALVAAWPDGIDASEWGGIAGALVAGFLVVFLAPRNSLSRDEVLAVRAAPVPDHGETLVPKPGGQIH
jgi:hypothetical protein